jgi:heme exporter protein B
MSFLNAAMAVLWKDLRTELRTKERLSTMCFFALLVVLIFNFAFESGNGSLQSAAPGIFWVAVLFSGLMGLTRSFNQERENDALMGFLLTPADRGAFYLGKTAANAITMAVMEILLLPLLAIFFNIPIAEHILRLIPVCFFGTLGFAAVGTLFAAMSINTRLQEALLPMLTLPILVPSILAAVEATSGVLAGEPLADLAQWLRILVAFSLLFLAACLLLFDYVVEE